MLTRLDFKNIGCFGFGRIFGHFLPKPKFCRNSYFWPKLAETESSVGHYLKQGCHATWRTRKSQVIWKLIKKIRLSSGNFIKLTEWQSSIKWTSRQCWKRMCVIRAYNLMHVIFFAEMHELLFNLWKPMYCSSDYRGILWSSKFFMVKLHKTLDANSEFWGFLIKRSFHIK